jgi:hypothetical protein
MINAAMEFASNVLEGRSGSRFSDAFLSGVCIREEKSAD